MIVRKTFEYMSDFVEVVKGWQVFRKIHETRLLYTALRHHGAGVHTTHVTLSTVPDRVADIPGLVKKDPAIPGVWEFSEDSATLTYHARDGDDACRMLALLSASMEEMDLAGVEEAFTLPCRAARGAIRSLRYYVQRQEHGIAARHLIVLEDWDKMMREAAHLREVDLEITAGTVCVSEEG